MFHIFVGRKYIAERLCINSKEIVMLCQYDYDVNIKTGLDFKF